MRALSIGETARRTRTVTVRDIELFTEMTGDRNPLHYDHQFAAASRFGEIIVQGGITTGLLNAIVASDLPGPGSVFLHVEWSFKAPVRPHDEITAEVEILETRQDKPIHAAAHHHHPPGRRRRARWDGARLDRITRVTEPVRGLRSLFEPSATDLP